MSKNITNHCLHCRHSWKQRWPQRISKQCPRCHSPYWYRQRRRRSRNASQGRCPYGTGVRTLRRLIKIRTNKCVVWPYANPGQYGAIDYEGKIRRVHVVAWALSRKKAVPTKYHSGNSPDNIQICHTCDNRPCINPRHLFKGNSNKNMDDMTKKGRRIQGDLHPMSKLSVDAVLEIRKLYGKIQVKDIANIFGVSPSSICNAYYGNTWRHVG